MAGVGSKPFLLAPVEVGIGTGRVGAGGVGAEGVGAGGAVTFLVWLELCKS